MNSRTRMKIMGSAVGAALVAISAISDAQSGRFPLPPQPVGIHTLHEELFDLASRFRNPRWIVQLRRAGPLGSGHF